MKLFEIDNNKERLKLTLLGIKFKLSKKLHKYNTLIYLLDTILIKNKKKIVFASYPDLSDKAKEY